MKQQPGDTAEVQELVWALGSEQITDAQFERLNQLLRDSQTAREIYLECMSLHAFLCWEAQPAARDLPTQVTELTASHTVTEKTNLARPRPSPLVEALGAAARSARRWLLQPTPQSLAIAAVVTPLLLLALLWFVAPKWLRPDGDSTVRLAMEKPVFVARLVRTVECIWADGGVAKSDGSFLQQGQRLDLRSGLAEIVFDSGARVILAGPADFRVTTDGAGHLDTGRLTARVPPEAVGFVISAPGVAVTDLGTEFGLAVEGPSRVFVQVFEGLVEAACDDPAAGTEQVKQRLRAGQSALIGADGVNVQNATGDREFTRVLPKLQVKPLLRWTFEDETVRDAQTGVQGVLHGGARIREGQLRLLDDRDYVAIADSDGTIGKLAGYTIEAWVVPDQTGAQNVFVLTNQSGPQESFSHQLRITAEGKFEHYTYDHRERWLTGTTVAQPGTLYHVVITAVSRGSMRLFVNGGEEAGWTGPLGQLWSGGNDFRIGGLGGPQNVFSGFRGSINELAVYSRALRSDEIRSLYRDRERQSSESRNNVSDQ